MALSEQRKKELDLIAQQKKPSGLSEQRKRELDAIAQSRATTATPTPKSGGFIKDTIGDVKETFGALKGTVAKTKEEIDKIAVGELAGEQGKLRSFGQAVGNVAGGISSGFGDLIKGAVKTVLPQSAEDNLKENISKGVQSIIPVAQKIDQALGSPAGTFYKNYTSLDDKSKRDVKALLGISQFATDLATFGTSKKVADVAVEKTADVIGSGVQKGRGLATSATEKLSSGLDIAKEVAPTKKGMLSGQISKALDLTQGDISNIKLSTGEDVGQWIAKNNLIAESKEATLVKVKDLVEQQYKAVRAEIANVPTVYGRISRLEDSLQMLKAKTKGILGQEDVVKEVDSLLAQSEYSLSDAQRVKELLDEQFSLYKATGTVKEGGEKAGLAKVRKELKEFIENEVRDHTGAEIGQLNKDVSVGQSILQLTKKRSTRDFTRANVSLSDLGVFGSGSIIGTPLVGAVALIAKRIMEAPAVRLKFAKFLNSLPENEVNQIAQSMIEGNIPKEVGGIVKDVL